MNQRPALFRLEAIEFQRSQRQWGEVALLQPLPTTILIWLLAAIFAALVAFLCSATYARKETVAGYLTPGAGTAKIFATSAGVVTGVYVHEGDAVQQGEPLLMVGTAQIAANGMDVNASVLDTLNAQRTLLQNQVAAEGQRAAAERDRLTALVRSLTADVGQFKAQIAAQNERIRLAESLVASAGELVSKGYLSSLEFKRRQENVLEQRQALNTLNRQLSDTQTKLTEAHYNVEQLPTMTAAKIQPLRDGISSVEQRIAEVNGRRAYVVRAPITGRVSMVQARTGEAADPRQLQIEIVPEHSALEADLFVPTRAAGFIKPGQEVRLLYEAFPYQNFGTYAARIERVSRTILTGSDTSAPVPLKEPAYRVTAALERSDIDANGEKIPLQADMQLRADIILERRPLITWLIAPLLGTRR